MNIFREEIAVNGRIVGGRIEGDYFSLTSLQRDLIKSVLLSKEQLDIMIEELKAVSDKLL